jgi:NADH-quinone oxidoreductase subunit L
MVYPLVLLAFFAICAGWVGIPAGFPVLGGHEAGWFQTFLAPMNPLEGHGVESQSLVPLLVSLGVSLGGLALGWQVYKNMKAGEVDPVKRAFGPLYTLLQNKYYIDEIYSAVFIRPAVWVAEQFTAVWMDKKVIDGIIHAVGAVTPIFGGVLRNGFDKPVISNGGDELGNGINSIGRLLRKVQTGRVQQYMIMTVWIMLISGMVAYYFLGAG